MEKSFSNEVKLELATLKENERMSKSVLMGMVHSVRHTSDKNVGIQSETKEVVDLFSHLLKKEMDIHTDIKKGNGKKPLYSCMMSTEEYKNIHLAPILNTMSIMILEDPEYESAWVRGSFLASGYISDPKKSYQLEFIFDSEEKAIFLIEILSEHDFDLRYNKRSESEHVVYLRDSTSIEDLLTFMGATQASMAIMEIKIYKGIRNNANRQTNFETANIEKTANAGAEQSFYIREVFDRYTKETLDDDMIAVGKARLKNDSATLEELMDIIEPQMSRSAIYRRLSKFKKLYEEMEKGD